MREKLVVLGALGGALFGAFLSTPAHAFGSVVEGLYRISPKLAPHKSFDLPGACPGLVAGAKLALYNYDSYNCNYPQTDQKWYIKQAGSDGNGPYYNIYQGANGSSMCLDLPNGQATNGNPIQVYTCNGNIAQQWYFNQNENGSLYGAFTIIPRVNTGYAVDLGGCNTENGQSITLWQNGVGTCDNSNGQRWVLNRADWDMLVQDWADDFTNVNTGTWNLETYAHNTFNSELQDYSNSSSNVYSDGRKLHIDAHMKSGYGANQMGAYTSGRIDTQNHAYYTNGAWSVSVRYFQNDNRNKGGWPAVWLLGESYNQGAAWPMQNSREIDFFEWMVVNGTGGPNAWANAGQPNNSGWDANAIWGNTAYQIGDMLTNHTGNPNANFNPQDWAIIKVAFDENVGNGAQIHYYVNGNQVQSWAMDAFYNQPYFPIINLAIGGMGGGDASGFSSTNDWASVQVDWIAHEKWCTAANMAAGHC